MNKYDIKNIIDTRYASLKPSRGSEAKILSAIAEVEPELELELKIKLENDSKPNNSNLFNSRHNKSIRVFRRPLVAFVVIISCIVLSFSVAFATVPEFRAMVENIIGISPGVTPELEEMLQVVKARCESEGIELEVVSAASTGEELIIVYTLRDITGQDRIDESSFIDMPIISGDTVGEAEYLYANSYFDENTKTLHVISVLREIGQVGPTLSFSFNNVRSIVEYEKFDTGIELAAISTAPKRYKTKKDFHSFYAARVPFAVLEPDEDLIPLPGIDFAYISAMGYINNQLHVQLYFPRNSYDIIREPVNFEDSGKLFLSDDIDTDPAWGSLNHSVGHFHAMEFGMEGKLEEFIYDLSPQDIKNSDLKLIGIYFCGKTNYVSGNWEVSFDLDIMDKVIIDPTLPSNANNISMISEIKEITMTPFMVKLEVTEAYIKYFKFGEIALKFQDGRILHSGNEGSIIGIDDRINVFYPILNEKGYLDRFDPNDVVSIIINGVEVSIK
jgi:hypothetical protein